MKRFLRCYGVVSALALVAVTSAFAQTTPPTVDAADLTPILYSVAAALLVAVLAILGPTFLAKVPFAIVNLVRKSISRLMGRAKPAAG